MAQSFMLCCLDLDGVLVNFVGGAMKLHGKSCPFEAGYTGWYFNRHWGMADNDLYKGMDRAFWSNLDWMHDGKQIFQLIEQFFGHEKTCILTSPCSMDGCYDGKRSWMRKHLPDVYHKKFLIGPAKEFCANVNTVLIDDNDDNIRKFRAHGGLGILVPRPWNENRDVADPVRYIQSTLEMIV